MMMNGVVRWSRLCTRSSAVRRGWWKYSAASGATANCAAASAKFSTISTPKICPARVRSSVSAWTSEEAKLNPFISVASPITTCVIANRP